MCFHCFSMELPETGNLDSRFYLSVLKYIVFSEKRSTQSRPLQSLYKIGFVIFNRKTNVYFEPSKKLNNLDFARSFMSSINNRKCLIAFS